MSGSDFFETLNYASVNEDWRTEADALRLAGGERVLCVTGSGDRPLDLLPGDPVGVVAIDLNPAQNHLLALKMAALDELEYPEYSAFLGLRDAPGAWRVETWRRLRHALSSECRSFWREHEAAIRAGVIYQGRWERHYRRLASLARLLRPRLIDTLFSFDDIGEQRDFVRERWDTAFWRAVWLVACHPLVSRYFFGDPAFYSHVAVSPGRILYDRMLATLERHLARENFMVGLVLNGRLPEGDLPPYLTEEGHALIRYRLDRVELVTADVVEFLHGSGAGRFHAFSLSDVPSFLSREAFRRLVEGVVRCAEPRARVCVRQFLTRYDVPDDLANRLERESRLEARLTAEDRAFAYDFIVGTVRDG